MSGLLGLLDLGASAFMAQNAGVAVSGRNLANVNTEGYSAERLDLQSQLAAPLVGGVVAGDPRRAESPLLSARERLGAGAFGMADARSAALQDLEGRLTGEGTDVAQAIGGFFGAVGDLAAAPLDDSLREAVVAAAQELADALRRAQSSVAEATATANQRIADFSAQATQLAGQIAEANKKLATGYDPVVADQRDLAAKQLAELTGGQARVDPDGQMRFVVGGGTVLVDGMRAASVQADPSGKVQVVDGTHVNDVTAALDGGRIAGEIAFRDGTAAQAGTDLDNLAYDIATNVNAKMPVFNQPASATGAAAGLTVAATAGSLATAAGGEGAAGNGNLLAVLALRDQPLAGGGTRSFVDEGIRTLGAVGSATASALASQKQESAHVDNLAALRDSLSGVSQEDEMARLSAFQRASEAATKFVATVNDLLQQMIETI